MRAYRPLFLMILLGVSVGLCGTIFRISVDILGNFIHLLLAKCTNFYLRVFLSASFSSLAVYFTWLMVRKYSPESAGSGVQEVDRALLRRANMRWRSVIPVKFFGGIVALSSMLVLGREGPTIQLGANLGAMFADKFNLNERDKKRNIAAGAAAGLATAFNAPLAGILFIFEEIRPEFQFTWVHIWGVSVVCMVAIMILQGIMGDIHAIHLQEFEAPSAYTMIIFLPLGLIIGVFGYIFNKSLIGTLNLLDKLSTSKRTIFVILSAALIGILAETNPLVVGGGYHILDHTFHASESSLMLFLMLVLRFALGLISYGIGVPGGIFAPILALGGVAGIFISSCLYKLSFLFAIEPGMFAIVGMAGLFAAVVRSHLTAVMLIIEMTKNGQMVLPLLCTCFVACSFMNLMDNPSI